ncbi:undecaprenyl-diphosphatase UppP [Campylobacter sp. VicNov18]|uniref:undecaprenyl-diphosphatase UppP n=1 Tax=Campylobacter bilis TaxID=2691918 RepID=UPI00130DA15A|nr:undecaprenyl-diphosphatase UppP [Campylobacter bilis]MPV62963.1 undecaprenyl-diphosphatase UppP [Campylobacter hepaticus]MBM0636462.1 undecaprenyl-diphosphatase UppP [Campylobacter bilis]MCC8277171.1 undecaprenyl-diphosphatase UppP [Campylobacter bilis]MCC8298914.1 undecaprenyl-diphosphatase UppP [Campylobacter bilis]MCC8300080.1 undecaprenyl-diphosphatase UppP [Campylobacter bilis]
MENFYAFILGVIEGLSEFLPISSTGHMILGTTILGISIDEFWKSFLIVIQLGSILAVVFVFWRKLFCGFDIWFKLFCGFFPTGLIGLFVAKYLNALFNGWVVVFMLIFGGVVFILIELMHKGKQYRVDVLEKISFKQAFCIGVFQALAMIPGTSRSGASIIGGLLLGLNRKTATEFSFLLAVPTMFIATAYSVYKEPELFENANSLIAMGIGFVTAFVVAVFVIKFFLRFVSRFDFIPFGVYRIVLGMVFFYLYYSGILNAGSEFDL